MNIPIEVYDKALPHRFAMSDEVQAFHVIAEWARKEALREAADVIDTTRSAYENVGILRALAEGDKTGDS